MTGGKKKRETSCSLFLSCMLYPFGGMGENFTKRLMKAFEETSGFIVMTILLDKSIQK